MFAVVEFSPTESGGGISIVNTEWLTPRKRQVFWPPYKDQKRFERSVKKSEEVNKETWDLFNVSRIFYESDDYEKTCKKLKQAEESSDIQTEEEDYLLSQRRIKRPSRFIADSESEEESKLPRPPKITAKLTNTNNETPLTSKQCLSENNKTVTAEILDESPRTTTIKKSGKGSIKIIAETLPETPSTSKKSEKAEFEIILRNLLEVKQDVKTLLKLVNSEKQICLGLKDDFPVELPMKSLENIYSFEEYIKTDVSKKSFADFITTFGGKDLVSKANRILKETISENIDSEFNFQGRNNKRAFSDLKLCSVIVESVKTSCGVTSKEVEDTIKIWLKQAPFRLKKIEQKRQANV